MKTILALLGFKLIAGGLPSGWIFLKDSDGTILRDSDGEFMMERI